MKAKLRGTTGLPFEVREVSCLTYEEFTGKEAIPFIQYYVDEEGNFYEATDLDFNLDPPQPEATISGWVAVDDFDNAYIYHSKPTQRCREFCDTGDFIIDWSCDTKYPNGKRCYVIDKDLFPELTPDSDPIEVEITIKPKKQ